MCFNHTFHLFGQILELYAHFVRMQLSGLLQIGLKL